MRGLCKSYEADQRGPGVLDDLDLDVGEGALVAISGRSGSGKTTLLNIIGGLDRRWSGTVRVAGAELHEMRDSDLSVYRNATVGFVFQTICLLPLRTCIDNVALASLFAPLCVTGTRAKARLRAAELLGRVGLGDRLEATPPQLSGGERQRVALARALFGQPRLLLCDEPTGNLDGQTAMQVVDILREVRGAGGTVVVASHDPHILESADDILELCGGRLSRPDGAGAEETGGGG